ncbi:MAG: acetate kinase [Rikenellaceae bacterium]|nr:acetate kinase [Rikenellaceae bacterium]MCL2691880.1 acetate kinase [Rikenellaceae bacterium]
MIILVLNCGSSSIKYQLIDMKSANDPVLMAKGLVERIGLPDAIFTHKPEGREKYEAVFPIPDHTVGINKLLELLVDERYGVLKSLDQLDAVGNRVAHGGEYFPDSAVVNDDVIAKIESCFELAPLHNPANMKGIMAVRTLLPNVPQVCNFDTSFHATIPAKNFLYALPYRYYEQDRVRKYGFHGTSHRYVAQKACAELGMDYAKSKIITCHIGNGASITAILNGRSFDTSMGFTPVDGLVMGTRCGEVDPGAILYIMDKEGLGTADARNMINKESGILGVSGISFDMRDIEAGVKAGNERAIVGFDMYNERIKKYVGGYAAKMGGVDLIVFTGGVGENGPETRAAVCSDMEFMGVVFDRAANNGVRGKDKVLSAPDSRVKVMVCTTNEELVIAQDTFRLLS